MIAFGTLNVFDDFVIDGFLIENLLMGARIWFFLLNMLLIASFPSLFKISLRLGRTCFLSRGGD